MSSNNNNLASQLRAALQTHRLPPPSQTWLQTLVSARSPPPPLPSLVMTAKTRILASDLTTTGLLDPMQLSQISFPQNLSDPTVKETTLRTDVYAQVLDVEDLSKSRWDQIEALEAVERGEFTRGREVIRLVSGAAEEGEGQQIQQTTAAPQQQQGPNSNNNNNNNNNSNKNSTHRLVLQDCKGQKIYALELTRVPKIGIGSTNIGEKVLLKKGTVIARGMVMLDPTMCEILGGKVEAWQKAWMQGRLARLKGTVAPAGGDS